MLFPPVWCYTASRPWRDWVVAPIAATALLLRISSRAGWMSHRARHRISVCSRPSASSLQLGHRAVSRCRSLYPRHCTEAFRPPRRRYRTEPDQCPAHGWSASTAASRSGFVAGGSQRASMSRLNQPWWPGSRYPGHRPVRRAAVDGDHCLPDLCRLLGYSVSPFVAGHVTL